MNKRGGARTGRQTLSEAARQTLQALGMGDYELQRDCRRVFDELYADRYHGRIRFLGLRDGTVFLSVRDGSWVRRARALEGQFIKDLNTLCDLGEGRATQVRVLVGASAR